MVTDNTKNQVRALFNKLSKEDFTNLSMTKCNGYLKQLEYIKRLLDGIGYHFTEEMEELYEVQEELFGGIDQEEIHEAMEKALEQIDLIMTRLGLEEEEVKKDLHNNYPMNISISPNFSQNQSAQISVESKVNNLYQEFEKELNKSNPDKLKLTDIVKTILKILGVIF
jgi:hypothetical protein